MTDNIRRCVAGPLRDAPFSTPKHPPKKIKKLDYPLAISRRLWYTISRKRGKGPRYNKDKEGKMIMELTLNKLIEIAKEKGIDFNMPILWHKSEKGTDYIELGMTDYTKKKGKGRLRYVGTISKGGYFYYYT